VSSIQLTGTVDQPDLTVDASLRLVTRIALTVVSAVALRSQVKLSIAGTDSTSGAPITT